MNASSIVLQIAIVGSLLQIRFITPGPGSYYLECSNDAVNWHVIASNHVAAVTHVAAHQSANQPCAFYRVEWRADRVTQ